MGAVQPFIPRPYQVEAVQSVLEAWHTGTKSCLVLMPTGTGKTVVSAELIRQEMLPTIGLAHRKELVEQLYSMAVRTLGKDRCAIEMGDKYAVRHANMFGQPTYVSASVLSIGQPNRLRRFKANKWPRCHADEAHHFVRSNQNFSRPLEHFRQNPDFRLIGLTATADRTDQQPLRQTFDECVYSYEILTAIDDGWLVPCRQFRVYIDGMDLSQIDVDETDFSAAQLEEILTNNEIELRQADSILQYNEGRQTLVFCSGVKQSRDLTAILNGLEPGCARAVWGGSSKAEREQRRQDHEDFQAGRFSILVNCEVYTEGTDLRGVGCVVMAAPTKSRSKYAQRAGRGFRILPDLVEGWDASGEFWRLATAAERRAAIAGSDKPDLLILDFEGDSGRHRLVHAGDILGPDLPEDVLIDMAGGLRGRGQPITVDQEIRDLVERRRLERERQLERLTIRTRCTLSPRDPFGVLNIKSTDRRVIHKRRPTSGMLRSLQKQGVEFHFDQNKYWIGDATDESTWEELDYRKAKRVLDELGDRREKGLASYKQLKLLKRYHEDTDGVTFEQASEIINEIAANGWQPRRAALERVVDQSREASS